MRFVIVTYVPQRSCRQYRLQSPKVVQSFLESQHTETSSESVISLDFDMAGKMSCDWIKTDIVQLLAVLFFRNDRNAVDNSYT